MYNVNEEIFLKKLPLSLIPKMFDFMYGILNIISKSK